AGGGQTLGLLHALHVFAEFAIHVFQLLASLLELPAVIAFPIGQIAGDETCDHENAELKNLILGVEGPSRPLPGDHRTTNHCTSDGGSERSPHSEEHARDHEREKV